MIERDIGLNGKTYNIIVAEDFLCVPTVLETILNSEGIHGVSRYDMANYFGVIFPTAIIHPKITNYAHSDNTREQGVTLKSNSLNDMFMHFHLPFNEDFIPIHRIDKDYLSEFLFDILVKSKHIICGYEYNTLYGLNGTYTGHVSIVAGVNQKDDNVVLLDPGPKRYGMKNIDAYNLYAAICKASDGLWIISTV